MEGCVPGPEHHRGPVGWVRQGAGAGRSVCVCVCAFGVSLGQLSVSTFNVQLSDSHDRLAKNNAVGKRKGGRGSGDLQSRGQGGQRRTTLSLPPMVPSWQAAHVLRITMTC